MKLNKSIRNIINFLFFISFIFANDPLAVVTKSSGSVNYKKFDTKNIKKPKMGMSIYNDDFFQTDKDGFVSFLYLDDATLIMMHKNSELYMRGKVDSKAITKRVNVGTGSVRFDVKKQKDEEFTVVTPTSVASVKGTDFFLNTDALGDNFYGFEGVVEVLNKESNTIINLTKNTKVTSLTDGTINIVVMSQEDFNLIQQIEESSGLNIDEGIIPEGDSEVEETDTGDEEIKEIRIKVQTLSGDEKEIIIRYTE